MHKQERPCFFARLKHLKREPLPDKELCYLTKVALGRRVWGKSPLLHERYSKDEEGQKKAIEKIGEMAEAGYNCNTAKTALDSIIIGQPFLRNPVWQAAIKTKDRIELVKPIAYDPEKICEQLTEFVGLIEARGLGDVGSILIVDRKTMDTFFRFGQGRFRPLGFPFSLFVHYDRPDNLRDEANGGRTLLWGRINLWGLQLDLGRIDIQKILAHELIHAQWRVIFSMLGLQYKYQKEHDQAIGLVLGRTIREGFADFAAYILTRHPEKEKHFQNAVRFTACNLVDLTDETVTTDLAVRVMAFSNNPLTEGILYSLGLNFFVKASELLGEEPMKYLGMLEKTPPTAVEIFSKQGGRKWAERVLGQAAENTAKTARQTH